MNQIIERIKEAYHLETDAEVADFLDIKPTTLSMQKNRGKLDLNRILNKCSDLNKNWLLDGKGPIRHHYLDEEEQPVIPIYSSIKLMEEAGPDYELSEEKGQMVAEADSAEYLHKYASINGIMGYIISGDSMTPTLKKKDIVIVDIENKKPDRDQILLISLGSKIMCKRFMREQSGTLKFISDNKDYRPLEIQKKQEDFDILGKVVWVIRSM